MLRLALLGHDDDALALARAAIAQPEFELTAICSVEPHVELPSGGDTPIRRDEHWEWLLHDDTVDAILVGRHGPADRDDLLRKLTQAGKPLLVTFPPAEAIFAFELEMIRRDSDGLLYTYQPHMQHPLMERFLTLGDSLGEVQVVGVERRLADCSRSQVRAAVAGDMAIMRRMLGRLARISAVGVSRESRDEANLTVTVQNEAEGVGRWSIEPTTASPSAVIVARGTAGKAQLMMHSDGEPWRLEAPGGEEIAQSNGFDPARAALEQFAAAVQRREGGRAWELVCRDLEAADMIDISLRRQRTIELYDEQVSEKGTFKGMMAAGGCFLLLLSLLVLLTVAVVEGLQAPFRDHLLWRLWPVYLLAPIVVFLLMQLLQLAIKKPSPTDGEA